MTSCSAGDSLNVSHAHASDSPPHGVEPDPPSPTKPFPSLLPSPLTMHDCDVEVLMPSLSHINDHSPSEQTPLEDIALSAAESGAREVTDVYIGETAFLLLIVRGPDSARLLSAVDHLDEVCVSAQTLSVEEPDSPPQAAAHKLPSPSANALPPPTPSAQSPAATSLPSPSPSAAPASTAGASPLSGALGPSAAAPRVPPLGLSPSAAQAPAGAPAARVLPILRESAWVSVADPARGGEQAGEPSRVGGPGGGAPLSPPRKVVCKGLWVLFRPPPEAASFYEVMALTGRQRLGVELREGSVAAYCRAPRMCVGDAVAKAGRLGAAPNCLVGSKVVGVHVPLDLSFRHVTAGGNDSRAFIAITARNTTSDAVLSVVPPYVNLAATTIVELDGDSSTAARTSARFRARSMDKRKLNTPLGGGVPATPASSKGRTPSAGALDEDSPRSASVFGELDEEDDYEPQRTRLSLEDHFSFQSQFGSLGELNSDVDSEIASESEGLSDDGSGEEKDLKDANDSAPSGHPNANNRFQVSPGLNVARMASDVSGLYGGASQDDFGVFIPSFGKRSKQAVSIGPREVFDFVFAVTPKLSDGALALSNYDGMPHLGANQCFETSVSVAWSCRPRGSSDSDRSIVAEKVPLQRELSSGGVLATGQRSNSAVRVLDVQWSPPSWREDVVMSFAGPSVAVDRTSISVAVTILNQTRQRLNNASLFIDASGLGDVGKHCVSDLDLGKHPERRKGLVDRDQRKALLGTEKEGELLPLRTVISVGAIEAGASTTVLVSCVVLGRGCASLGAAAVADCASSAGVIPQLWRAQTTFKTFVVDQHQGSEAAASSPTRFASKKMTMITEDLSVVEL